MNNMKSTIIISVLFALTACASRQAPYEKITRHYVYQQAAEDSDPNFHTHINGSVKLMTPFFKQFYDAGIKDKTNGITQQKYKERINYFRSNEFLSTITGTTQFISPKIHTEKVNESERPDRQKKILTDNIIAAYEAGYSSRQNTDTGSL
ncbi:Exc2 family lipoprotein [Morganella morganii]|nr:Exc2 family lipoprotein [Morganella morganii]